LQGISLYSSGKSNEAFNRWKDALKINSEHFLSYFNLEVAKLKSGLINVDQLARGLSFFPEN
jgi:hypothetical protein